MEGRGLAKDVGGGDLFFFFGGGGGGDLEGRFGEIWAGDLGKLGKRSRDLERSGGGRKIWADLRLRSRVGEGAGKGNWRRDLGRDLERGWGESGGGRGGGRGEGGRGGKGEEGAGPQT